MALDVITWFWGNKYEPRDIVRLANSCKKHLTVEHRFHVFADRALRDLPESISVFPIVDRQLIDRHCFCRLRMFDPIWQTAHRFFGTIVSLDLDLLILGNIDRYFTTSEAFMILQGVNAVNPNPFNASIMKLRAGCRSEVWIDFSIKKASKIQRHDWADDQGWIWHKLPNAAGWKAGKESGIYGFNKPGWPGGYELPADARIVAFIGKRKPHMYWALPWIKKHWIDAA